jgi:uncharacterized DUF497 family protein
MLSCVSFELELQWDDAKAKANLAKHGIAFAFAIEVFGDLNRLDVDASRAADGETRRKVVGRIGGKLYTVVYTDRGSARQIISARRSNRSETSAYRAV